MDRRKVRLVIRSALGNGDDVIYLGCAWSAADVAAAHVAVEDAAGSPLLLPA